MTSMCSSVAISYFVKPEMVTDNILEHNTSHMETINVSANQINEGI
jgi:hypothetical protein